MCISIFNEQLQFIHIEILGKAETWRAITLTAVQTQETVFVASHDSLASITLAGLVTGIGGDHSIACFVL